MSFTLLSLVTLGGGSVSAIYVLPRYQNVTPGAPWVGEVDSSSMITVSQTYLCRKCTLVAILVTARPLHSLTGNSFIPTTLGNNIGYVWGSPYGGGRGRTPLLSPSRFHAIMGLPMNRQQHRCRILTTVWTLYWYGNEEPFVIFYSVFSWCIWRKRRRIFTL